MGEKLITRALNYANMDTKTGQRFQTTYMTINALIVVVYVTHLDLTV